MNFDDIAHLIIYDHVLVQKQGIYSMITQPNEDISLPINVHSGVALNVIVFFPRKIERI
jgi:hypothetical protein